MTQRNALENINKLADAFKNKGSIDVIFDHDGTMMDSSMAEAKRIFAILCSVHPTLSDSFVAHIHQLGYGKNGVWASKLLAAIKTNSPELAAVIDANKAALEEKIDPETLNVATIQMGMNVEEIPGTADFVRTVIDKGNMVAVFSGNWPEVVHVGLNKHLAKVNVSCPAPRGTQLAQLAIELVKNFSTQSSGQHAPASISAFNDSHGQTLRRKPEADGLLMQKFSLLLQRGVVTADNANKFLTDSVYRNSFSKHEDYRQSIYVGDDLIDLQAAIRAGFDHFIAINGENTTSRKAMYQHVSSIPDGAINIVYVENLAEAKDLLFSTKVLGFGQQFGAFVPKETNSNPVDVSAALVAGNRQ